MGQILNFLEDGGILPRPVSTQYHILISSLLTHKSEVFSTDLLLLGFNLITTLVDSKIAPALNMMTLLGIIHYLKIQTPAINETAVNVIGIQGVRRLKQKVFLENDQIEYICESTGKPGTMVSYTNFVFNKVGTLSQVLLTMVC